MSKRCWLEMRPSLMLARMLVLVFLVCPCLLTGCAQGPHTSAPVSHIESSMVSGASFETELSKRSRAVRMRDGCCYMCGSTENLHDHHILPKAVYPEIALKMWNGITLCEKCHRIVHTNSRSHLFYVPIFFQYTMRFEKGIKE